jgi:DNA primase
MMYELMALSAAEQVKEILSVTDVVGGYVKLERAGINLKARCPFHREKTPSFFVSPTRNTYHCFGCGVGGDIFSFVEAVEGLDFRGALKLLADRAGVQIATESKQVRDDRSRLYAILEAAAIFFEGELQKKGDVSSYLAERKINDSSISKWRIGFAPDAWRSLLDHLEATGYIPRDVELAGLIKKNEKGEGFYDRFRNRIMFPISDTSGRIIAFSGRIFGQNDSVGKYVNSPETVLFNKSQILYGYDVAKYSIRKADCAILVEGQVDLVMSHQAGYTNSVALSGTALTSDHIAKLKRLSSNLVMAFDADEAGLQSLWRAAELALSSGMDARAVAMPAGNDPADLIRAGVARWKSAVRSAKHVIDFYIDKIAKIAKDERSFRLEVQKKVIPLIASIGNAIDREHFVSRVSSEIGLPEEAIREEVLRLGTGDRGLLENEKSAVIDETSLPDRRVAIERRLFGIIFREKSLNEQNIDIDGLEKRIKEILNNDDIESLQDRYLAEKENLLFEAELFFDSEEGLYTDLDELITNLEKEFLREKIESAIRRLRQAEEGADSVAIEKAMSLCQRLNKQMEVLQSLGH